MTANPAKANCLPTSLALPVASFFVLSISARVFTISPVGQCPRRGWVCLLQGLAEVCSAEVAGVVVVAISEGRMAWDRSAYLS